ncbi:hypothetical protein OJ997_28190, partial [Solirubrobacter phytolaccae]|nr:hypothetical protein [Solirubrobacter phytolaccae]
MDPIAVTAALLRAQLPEVPIREGASMMARVASRGQTHAVIVIAGMPITAQLPPEIPAGATLRLRVKEVTAERVWMQIEPEQSQAGGEAAPARPPVPKPPVPSGVYAPPIKLPGAPAQPGGAGAPAKPGTPAQPGAAATPAQP